MDEPDRRLLAIVCADVAGYSRLMSEDEEGTFARLQTFLREIVYPSANRHQGRIVKTMGDGFLAEFGSAIKALGFAIEIQRQGAASTNVLPVRVGVHVGDVIANDGDVFGDGVNIAARLQQLAEPGGVLVSRAVRDHARDHFQFEDAGERALKNIARPVRTFRVLGVGPRRRLASSVKARSRWRVAAALALTVTVALIGLRLATGYYLRELPPGIERSQPSVAVLPFVNRSGDPSQEYFSDGLAENVLTTLARFPHLFVVSRNSTFSYKGRATDLAEIGRVLGVRYVLEGSVQKADDQVRVTAQLTDTRTGAQIWADRYDRPMRELFAIQDEIAAKIAVRLGASIQQAEVAASLAKPPTDLTTYDYYLRGRSLRQTGVKEQAQQARTLFARAIELDPKFAPALAELAFAYYREVSLRWDPSNRHIALARGLAYAERALAADPTQPMAHMVMGDLLLRGRAHEEAIRWAKRAIELNPSEAEYYAGLANILTFAGRSDEAVSLMRQAFVFDPLHQPNFDMYLGRALLASRRFEEALPPLRECAHRAPDYWPCHLFSAVTYAYLDQPAAAKASIDDLRRNSQIRTIKDYLGSGEYLPEPADLIRGGLQKAGLPLE